MTPSKKFFKEKGVAFSKEEQEIIFHLATEITGSNQEGTARKDILASNVARRMQILQVSDLSTYLLLADEDPEEFNYLISSLTIHTTSWFRELAHYELLKQKLEQYWNESNSEGPYQIWSAACSTGEEAYSFALVLEQFRVTHPGFEYKIWGTDIDPISVDTARSAIYRDSQFDSVPSEYRKYLLRGEGKTRNLFTLSKEIRVRCKFNRHDLTKAAVGIAKDFPESFQLIVCRNVLIYFKPNDVDQIITHLVRKLHPKGNICLGHSEAIDGKKHKLSLTTNSTYQFAGNGQPAAQLALAPRPNIPKKILIIDDSNTIRQMLLKALQGSKFEGTAVSSAREATEYLKANQVDLITLDLHMPEEDGPTWLKKMRLLGMKTPVFIISDASPEEANSVLGALENGAQDYIEKGYLKQNKAELLERFHEVIEAQEEKKNFSHGKNKNGKDIDLFQPDLILLGASTGGTNALADVLKNFPKNAPPVLVVQHISKEFCWPFAKRLSEVSGIPLGNCEKEGPLKPGHLYLAFGDYHLGIASKGGSIHLVPSDAPLMNRHRPSVDHLFHSAARTQAKCLAVLLTGMGKDGARGMLELRNKGAITFAQDQESSVVFGMPAEAIKIGGASFVGNLAEIREQINKAIKIKKSLAG